MIVPSAYYENYPLAALSALAHRVPVITSKIGGIPKIAKDGMNELLFDFRDTEQLVTIIRKIADDPNIVNKLRAGIVLPRRVEEEADYENPYRDLTNNRQPNQAQITTYSLTNK
jgi:glycosyltransferase involved in cell wall biosynthesis